MVKLTTLSHGGGCGCKIAPDVLSKIIRDAACFKRPDELLVSGDTLDDAVVYRLDDERAMVATTDFFMPIVDRAYDFGTIAAANALSDIYAMAAKPLFALNIVAMPLEKLSADVIAEVMAGGADVCRQVGVAVAGGHSIDSTEPIYGLSVVGMVDIQNLKTNATARADDALILSKPLGIGVLASALREGKLDDQSYREMMHWTSKLNQVGERLGQLTVVHAMTDVTGFGLLGHLSEICRASSLAAEIRFEDVPLIKSARDLARQGVASGASGRNLKAYHQCLHITAQLDEWRLKLLTDPQTSGGLLISCVPEAANQVLSLLREEGFDQAAVIGSMREGSPTINLAA